MVAIVFHIKIARRQLESPDMFAPLPVKSEPFSVLNKNSEQQMVVAIKKVLLDAERKTKSNKLFFLTKVYCRASGLC